MKSEIVESRQFFIWTFGLTVGTSVLVIPSSLALTAREDAWIGALVSLAINLLMVLLYIAISRRYPDLTWFEIMEAALGKPLGKLATCLYLFYFLILAGTLLGNLGFFLTSEILVDTPIEAIQVLFLVAVVFAARLGIAVFARVGELLFPWIVFFSLCLILALLPHTEWTYIQPVLENGWGPVLRAGFHTAMFQELVVLMAFLPLTKERRRAERSYFRAAGLGGLLLTIVVLLSVLVLGVQQAANSTFPAYALAKTIFLGEFIQRIEGALIALWILSFFVKTMLLTFAQLQGLKTLFGLRSYRHLIYPLAALILIVAWNTYIDSVYVAEIIQKVWANYSFVHLVLFPVLILAVGLCRRQGRRTSK
ncbi:GerAB/ArcD/ProY family transporter [Cohnella cellulosilytica]|uniref:Endospore germination permease n=1 Tax=Cohnella cellulosilytica TaxID=986710 RepID=A0ABW2FCU0_9BACL